ncbi:MAG: hypothetical protein HQL69_17440 [Magnetococcales bacterium]|nr:hypothetical protein [Magnetococcales bacterium]
MNEQLTTVLVEKYGETMGYEDLKGFLGYQGATISFNNLVNASKEPLFVKLREAKVRVGRRIRFMTRTVAGILEMVGMTVK